MKKSHSETDEKLCPFMKKVSRKVYFRELTFTDMFCRCLGDKCMAFSDGICLRFGEENIIINNNNTYGD